MWLSKHYLNLRRRDNHNHNLVFVFFFCLLCCPICRLWANIFVIRSFVVARLSPTFIIALNFYFYLEKWHYGSINIAESKLNWQMRKHIHLHTERRSTHGISPHSWRRRARLLACVREPKLCARFNANQNQKGFHFVCCARAGRLSKTQANFFRYCYI